MRQATVLHVDDDPDFVEMGAALTEQQDDRLQIETVTGPTEGLDRLSSEEYHCVVSDYDMPHMDGIEFLHQVRERWDIPFILFTGKGSEKVASDAISAGATDYIQKKPGTEQYELLANRIVNAVSQSRAEKQVHEERQRFRTLFDHLSQPTVEVEYEDGEPIVRRVNAAFETTFGYDATDLVGDSINQYIIPDDPATEPAVIDQPFQSGDPVEMKEVTRQTTNGPREFLVQTATYDNISGGFAIYTDITDRSERHKEVKHSRDVLRHTEELAGVGGWEADIETGEVNWTQGTYEIHDLNPDGEFEPTIEAATSFYHPEDQSVIETAVENCQTHGELYEHELRLITAENNKKWVRATGEPVYDGDNLVKFRGAIQDITAQRERKEELQSHERLIKSSPELLFVMDEDMTINYQSPPSPLLDWEPPNIVGEDPIEYVHPDDHEKFINHFTEAKNQPDRISTVEFRARDANENWRWIESRGQNFTDSDAIEGVLGAMREVTQRKQQEQQLAQYSTILEQLQSTTQTLLETTDSIEAAERAVEGFETVLEFDIAGVWLREADQRMLTPVAVSDRGQELISNPPTYGPDTQSLSWEAYQNQELRYISDMSAHDQRVSKDTPIKSEMIIPLGEHGVVNIGSTKPDAFTEQEIDLIELWSDTLTTAFERITQMELLREREAELVRERDRLNEFASVVSHDLRNPLNVAHGQATILQQQGDDKLRHHLDPVIESLERMECIIEDTLTLAQQGETIGEMESISITELITKCWAGVETAEATLHLDDNFTIRGDPDRLRHVFENLFRNAVEHGGDNVSVQVGYTGDCLYIEDDGSGIPATDRETILEPGYTSASEGTGLGLTIVKRIVEAHGWKMRVVDGRDGGARFEFDTA